MQPFDFLSPAQITFGADSLKQLPQLTKGFGARALVVGGRNRERGDRVVDLLTGAGVSATTFSAAREPTLDAIRHGVRAAREGKVDFVVGIGGGSAMDTAKAIAALTTNSGEPLDYLELVGQGQPLEQAPLPCVTIPTTAGSGAEVTRNAVLNSPEHGWKVSLRGPGVLARLALVDPQLTIALPPALTAQGGFDTLTQLLEALVSRRANALTSGFCREGLVRVARSLRRAYQAAQDQTTDMAARAEMSFASLLSGLALANAGLGSVHGFASPLGSMIDAPHGAICASLLGSAVTINVRALRERQPDATALRGFAEAAEILTGVADASALADWLLQLRNDLQIQPLRELGLQEDQIALLVERAAKASSMRGNPIDLTEEEMLEIVQRSF